MGKKRAFIVTDSFLYKNGYYQAIDRPSSTRWASQHACVLRCLLPTRTLQAAP